MAECARCGDFTDNPAEVRYHYCDDCIDEFDTVRESGVVIEPLGPKSGYTVSLPGEFNGYSGGEESNQVNALARGKWLCNELGLEGLFIYHKTGSVWLIDEYLNSHRSIHQKVRNRVSRVPEKARPGLLTRLRNMF